MVLFLVDMSLAAGAIGLAIALSYRIDLLMGERLCSVWTWAISCSWSHAFSSGLMHCIEAMVIEAKWDSNEYFLSSLLLHVTPL
jgi:hypothetical protein